jgi:uracil-DNA glycosylase
MKIFLPDQNGLWEVCAVTSSYPRLWPEEQVPGDAEGCTDCGLHLHGSRMVWGEGNPTAPIWVLLDNPGAREDREGKSYVCGTRETLQEAVDQVGLTEKDLYVTYLLKRRPHRAYDKESVRRACLKHLERQLGEKSPQWVICLGNVAVQWFFLDLEAEVRKLRGSWHRVREVRTRVSYHPLAVRRRPNLRSRFLEDWRTGGRSRRISREIKRSPPSRRWMEGYNVGIGCAPAIYDTSIPAKIHYINNTICVWE